MTSSFSYPDYMRCQNHPLLKLSISAGDPTYVHELKLNISSEAETFFGARWPTYALLLNCTSRSTEGLVASIHWGIVRGLVCWGIILENCMQQQCCYHRNKRYIISHIVIKNICWSCYFDVKYFSLKNISNNNQIVSTLGLYEKNEWW
jgi:hypothetical protein